MVDERQARMRAIQKKDEILIIAEHQETTISKILDGAEDVWMRISGRMICTIHIRLKAKIVP